MSDKLTLRAEKLTLRDLKRAKAGPLEGRDPGEVLFGTDRLERMTLIAWCVHSRHDPEFSWADAEAVELGDFNDPDPDEDAEGLEAPDPPTASPSTTGGVSRADDARPASTPKPPKPAPEPSSASSSA